MAITKLGKSLEDTIEDFDIRKSIHDLGNGFPGQGKYEYASQRRARYGRYAKGIGGALAVGGLGAALYKRHQKKRLPAEEK